MASRRFGVIHPVHTTYDDDGFYQEETQEYSERLGSSGISPGRRGNAWK
jgi:hypothetical protein